MFRAHPQIGTRHLFRCCKIADFIRRKYGMNIMAIKQNGKMDMSVQPDTVLTSDMTLLVLGEDKMLQKFFQV